MGLGRSAVRGRSRVPSPPASKIAFTENHSFRVMENGSSVVGFGAEHTERGEFFGLAVTGSHTTRKENLSTPLR